MPNNDLWGDLPQVESIRTPFVILKEQAELLQEKTNGLLSVDVTQTQNGTQFIYDFKIIAPTLNNYSYHILTAIYDLGFYPVTLVDRVTTRQIRCEDEEEYMQGLRNIFSSEHIQTAIRKLLTHISSQD